MATRPTRENVRVVARVRPQNAMEKERSGTLAVKLTDTNIVVTNEDLQTIPFTFDKVFGMDSTQKEVFEDTTMPLIADVLSGYNATVFAYGQTSSGKTYTMEGADIHSSESRGIVPRSLEQLFVGVDEAAATIDFQFKVSYVEIYMEKIRDLLDNNRVKVNLSIREDKMRGIYIVDVTELDVISNQEVLDLMAQGAYNRATAATGMNEGSSRSHSVFTVTVQQKDTAKGTTTSGKLVLVDLAGSEMVRKTNASGQQLEEAKTINKSLSALGQVINALTDEKKDHVPYRDSKLTRILQDSLGGNSKTVLIVACSPSTFNAQETISTLRFGMRAKSIQNKVTVNQTRSVEELENLLLRAENAIDAQYTHIQALTAQLIAYKEQEEESEQDGRGGRIRGGGDGDGGISHAQAEAQRSAIEQLEQRIQSLQTELQEEKDESNRKSDELEHLNDILKQKEELMQEAGEVMLEAQKRYETQKGKAEQASRELAEVTSKFDGAKSQYEEELSSLKFKIEEMELTSDRLQEEKSRIQSELDEVSGGNRDHGIVLENVKKQLPSMTPRTPDTPPPLSPAPSSDNLVNNDFMSEVHATSVDSYDVSQPRTADLVPTTAILSDLNTLLGTLSITEDTDKTKISQFVEKQLQAKKFIISALERRTQNVSNNAKTLERRTEELEAQRVKLEKDLKSATEANLKNRALMDEIPRMATTAVSEMMIDRDRNQMKNLQHRLEQLVAVHRQLLRKYGTLELENTEMRKKLDVRERAIKRLEGNSKSTFLALRRQAERHAVELSNLRDQVQSLENERRSSPNKVPHHHAEKGPRTMRGGAGGTHGVNSSPSNSRDPGDPSTNASPKSPPASVVESVFSKLGFA